MDNGADAFRQTDGLLELYIYDDNGNLTYTITDPDYIAAAEHHRLSSESGCGTMITVI